jgi:hypothetical protein
MKKAACSISILWIVLLMSSPAAFCLEKPTHEAINEKIALGSFNGFSLDTYLKNNLGFIDGTIEEVNGQKVFEWLKLGGKKEDEPMYTRSLNHFHNPLKEPWSSAGLKGTSKSSILWAHDQGLAGFLTGGDFAWKNVREYFYIALTGKDFSGTWIAYSQAEKEIYYGATFRGIGQVMHLVEDASVPAHTRDDAHVVGYHYEKAVDKLRRIDHPIFLNAVANPITFNPSILSLPPNPLAPIPIAKIFDTDQYISAAPDPNVTVGSAIGLSEYANANFVSEGLLSANFQDFPYPRIQDTTIIGKSITSSSGTYTRQYYLKNCCGETNAGQGYLLSTVDLLDYWRQKYPLLSAGLPKIPGLDDNVYKDYASLLIPRAVGYSAGLLDYFFRGNIEITRPDSGVYAQTDNPNTGFTSVKLLAKNTTSTGEEMTDGSIELVVKYKLALDDPFQSSPVPTTDEFFYKVVSELNSIRSIPKDSPVLLTFDLGQNTIIPLNATDVYLQIVYRGKFEKDGVVTEDGAVAVGFKDISEPTPIDIFNNMDKICLNGAWYNAGSPEAIAVVDTNNNGIAEEWDVYAHDIKDIYVRFSPDANPQNASPTAYNYYFANLSAGTFSRALYILSDYQFSYSFYITWIRKDASDPWTHIPSTYLYSGTAIKNQTEDIRYYPTFYNFRNTDMWWGGGLIYRNAPYPSDSECSYNLL